jgi:hypothetical protein
MGARFLPVLTLLAGSVALAQSSPGGLHYSIPPGWLDLSPGAPAANFARVPKEVVDQARNPRYLAMAIDMDHAKNGFAANLNVVHSPCPGPLKADSLPAAAHAIQEAGRAAGTDLHVVSHEIVTIGGVAAARFLDEMTLPPHKLRQYAYLIPNGQDCAVVTYTATQERWGEYRPVFEAAALATGGVRALPESERLARSLGQLTGFCAGAGAVVGLVVWLARRKRT